MPNASIGGLASGLDTATIISQLMQLEARPQTLLKVKVSTAEKVVTALQALNTKLAAIATKAAGLSSSADWNPTKATSSNDAVLVTTSPGATPGALSFTVGALAKAASETFATTGSPDTLVMDPGLTYRITYADGRAAEDFTTGTGSLEDVAAALNAKAGVRSTMVMAGSGATPTYELRVESTATGSSSGFTITQIDPNAPDVPLAAPVAFLGGPVAGKSVQGGDAELTIAGQSTPLAFSSNTIKDLMPGVHVTLSADAEPGPTTVTVERDTSALGESVKAMVESVNAALGEIGTLTAYDATTKKGGLLGGDSTLRKIRNELIESVSGGLAGQSLSAVGIEVDRYGKLTFDEEKFATAYADDPVGAAEMLAGSAGSPGFADVLEGLGKTFSDKIDGTVTLAIKNRQSAISGLEDAITGWDARLATKESALRRQYTALETALGQLQSQGNWLAGQLAGLPSWNSGQ